MSPSSAPALDVTEWLNGPDQDLAALRGRVVLIEAFQMLCPGCVSRGLPQAQRVHRGFGRDEVVVLGLHTVFEHHDVMGRDALGVFLSEYRIEFPVGIDRHDGDATPVTMARYGLRGTPSTLLIDKQGRLRLSAFGAVDDLELGVQIGQLLAERATSDADTPVDPAPAAVCTPDAGCS